MDLFLSCHTLHIMLRVPVLTFVIIIRSHCLTLYVHSEFN